MLWRRTVKHRWILFIALFGVLLPLSTLAQEPVDLSEVEGLDMRGDDSALQAVEDAEETYSPFVEAYAKDHNLPLEEAQNRLRLQHLMIELSKTIQQAEETFGGSWLEHSQEAIRLIVTFASRDAETILASYLKEVAWADLVEARQTEQTLEKLKGSLPEINDVVVKTGVPASMGITFDPIRVQIGAPNPDELRAQLRGSRSGESVLSNVEIVEQELAKPDSFYPYVRAGSPLSSCTSGYAVKHRSTGQVYMSTAGHCPNHENVNNSTFLGPVVYDYNPEFQSHLGYDLDFQVHDIRARALHATNIGKMGNNIGHVVATESSSLTPWNVQICKQGRITGLTCGYITSISDQGPFAPFWHLWGSSVRYSNGSTTMACPGDSGGPIGRENGQGGIIALGLHVGSYGNCGIESLYMPIDHIHNNTDYRILIQENPLYYHQHVFWSETNCVEQKVLIDGNGNLQWSEHDTRACKTTLPSDGTLKSYTTLYLGDTLQEAVWQEDQYGVARGYIRLVPLKDNGSVDWDNAPTWGGPCCLGYPAASQGDYILGNYYYQNIFYDNGNCVEQKVPIDDSGNLLWEDHTSQSCHTNAPPGTEVQSYDAYVVGGMLHESSYVDNQGYTRIVPLNANQTIVEWGQAGGWTNCAPYCNGSGPRAQSAYIASHPHGAW